MATQLFQKVNTAAAAAAAAGVVVVYVLGVPELTE